MINLVLDIFNLSMTNPSPYDPLVEIRMEFLTLLISPSNYGTFMIILL